MHSVEQLEKQQVGLRLPKYLLDEIDEFTQTFSVNRTDIITEAIKSYVNAQKANAFYEGFNDASGELKQILEKKKSTENVMQLGTLIDELENC